MLDQKETYNYLNKFAKYVIQQSRSNLTKQGKNVNKNLYNSLSSEIEVGANSFRLDFLMEEYGLFQDQGVKGVGGVRKTTSKFKRSNNKGKMWKQNGKGSPFSFKEGNKPSVKHFIKWANSKSLNAFAVRDVVYHQGIKPSLFFTRPFEAAFENLPDELVEAFGLDIEKLMEHSLKNIK
jgi:hypothetical protein